MASGWANETHRLAIEDAYADVPVEGPPPTLDQKYIEKNEKVVGEADRTHPEHKRLRHIARSPGKIRMEIRGADRDTNRPAGRWKNIAAETCDAIARQAFEKSLVEPTAAAADRPARVCIAGEVTVTGPNDFGEKYR